MRGFTETLTVPRHDITSLDAHLMPRPLRYLPLLTLLYGPLALAFSQGSPICEVNGLPLVEMSPTLANPAPAGWVLEAAERYLPGRPLGLRLRNTLDPERRARGVLLWAKSGPISGSGSFTLPGDGRWQYVPAPANCGTWALSHADAQPKNQTELYFEWTSGDPALPTLLRAFIVEDCGAPGGCRDQQALTPILVTQPGFFFDGFETDPLLPPGR